MILLAHLIDCGLPAAAAEPLLPLIQQGLSLPAVEGWQYLTRHVLCSEHPPALHQLLYDLVFAQWDRSLGPPPVWIPTPEQIQTTHIAELLHKLGLDSYAELHAWSVQHRAEFWELMIRRLGIRLQQPYQQIMNDSAGVEAVQWLPGAKLNIVESCFQAAADAAAIVFASEHEPPQTWTYGELLGLVNRVANGLGAAGFQPGDPIAIAMPMTPAAVAIYLGIIKAGGVVVSIADSFAAGEIAARLRIGRAQAVFTQDCIIRGGQQLPLYSKIMAAEAPRAIVLPATDQPPELRPGDLHWEDFLSPNSEFAAVATEPAAPIHILFSSGTTGDPKAIPWTQTTPIKCAADGHLHQDIHPSDVVAWHTSLGWMMGAWLIYASLINRATIALYSGSPCDRSYGQFIQDARVTMLGVVPSLVSTWKASRCMQGLDWSAIKAFSSTGECSNPQDMLYLMALAGYKPIVEYCGGTEIGGAYVTGTLVQPAAPATFTTPTLGLDLVILDADGQPASKGEAFLVPPSIGLSAELLNRDHHQVYYAYTPALPGLPVLRRHGDRLERLGNGYYRMQGRVDDTMNLSGIKVSSVEIEQLLSQAEGICEAAAIAVAPPDGGPSRLVVYAVVADPQAADPIALKALLQKLIKQQLNPLFKIHEVVVVESLPRTASNKLMRRVLRDRYRM